MKIISFSLWGNNPKYNIGAIKNAELAHEIYPDWLSVFYLGRDVPHSTVKALGDLAAKGYKVMPVHMLTSNAKCDWSGMFWRFQPSFDSVMISRDCDSRLSLREKVAVDEWLTSDKTFHIMRDHPWHGSPMLGGMWGVKGPCPMICDLMEQWPKEDRYQTDQDFLKTMIYPIASKDAMIHAQFCAIEPDAIPFPSRRNGYEFVGQVFDENDITVAEHETMLRKALKMQGEPVRQEHLPQCLQDLIKERDAQ